MGTAIIHHGPWPLGHGLGPTGLNETNRDRGFSGIPARRSPVAFPVTGYQQPKSGGVVLVACPSPDRLPGSGVVGVVGAESGWPWVGSSKGSLGHTPLRLIDRRLTETLETLNKCPLSGRAMTSTIDGLQSDHWQLAAFDSASSTGSQHASARQPCSYSTLHLMDWLATLYLGY